MEFTPKATQALENARQLARDLSHQTSAVSTSSLVYSNWASAFISPFSVASASRRIRSGRRLRRGSPSAPFHRGPTFDISATATLERADAEADAMRHTYTGTEHILLGLLAEEDGGAADLFASRGVDIAKARQRVFVRISRFPTGSTISIRTDRSKAYLEAVDAATYLSRARRPADRWLASVRFLGRPNAGIQFTKELRHRLAVDVHSFFFGVLGKMVGTLCSVGPSFTVTPKVMGTKFFFLFF